MVPALSRALSHKRDLSEKTARNCFSPGDESVVLVLIEVPEADHASDQAPLSRRAASGLETILPKLLLNFVWLVLGFTVFSSEPSIAAIGVNAAEILIIWPRTQLKIHPVKFQKP